MIKWIRDQIQARRERKIIEALIHAHLATLKADEECHICEDDCEQCICGELDCD